MTIKEFAEKLNCEVQDLDLVKVAAPKDYAAAYNDYVDFEKSFNEPEFVENLLSFRDFMKEFNKGYSGSGCIQVARLVELDTGIYYDNDYVG